MQQPIDASLASGNITHHRIRIVSIRIVSIRIVSIRIVSSVFLHKLPLTLEALDEIVDGAGGGLLGDAQQSIDHARGHRLALRRAAP
jgi:hypothetical protein